MPLCRPSVTTSAAPASRSARHSAGQRRAASCSPGAFAPISASTVKSAAARRDQRPLLRLRHRHRAPRDLDVHEPGRARPGQALGRAALRPGDLQQGAAEAGGDAVRGQQLDLRGERRVDVGGAPAELPDVDVRRRGVEQVRGGPPAGARVEHVGQPGPSRLRRQRRAGPGSRASVHGRSRHLLSETCVRRCQLRTRSITGASGADRWRARPRRARRCPGPARTPARRGPDGSTRGPSTKLDQAAGPTTAHGP